MNDHPSLDTETCRLCGLGFTAAGWEARHSDEEGEDIHEGCCEAEGPCLDLLRAIERADEESPADWYSQPGRIEFGD